MVLSMEGLPVNTESALNTKRKKDVSLFGLLLVVSELNWLNFLFVPTYLLEDF